MKTEKIDFGKIKDILKRDEMKQIVAGCGGSSYWVSSCINGNTYWALCNSTTGECKIWHSRPGCYA